MDKNKSEYNKRYYLKNKDRLDKYSKGYRETHKEEAKLRTKEWLKKHRHPCLDCGKLISYKGTRCCPCAGVQFRKPQSYCMDCGIPTSRGRGLRCHKCAGKAKRTIPRLNDNQFISKDGYIAMKNPNPHYKKGYAYILEHRFVWEQAHGKIPEKWYVHHLNGIRTDNRLENLVAVPPAKHDRGTYVKALQNRISILENLLKEARK
jgi:hypothetical protein